MKCGSGSGTAPRSKIDYLVWCTFSQNVLPVITIWGLAEMIANLSIQDNDLWLNQ